MADVPILTGEEIVNTALSLDLVNGEALHFREWFNRLHRAGYAVAGKEPLKVMCSALHRHPLIKFAGDGTFERDDKALRNLRAMIIDLREQIMEYIDDPVARDPLIVKLQQTERIVGRYGGEIIRSSGGSS